MKEIPLTQGYCAIVDDDMFPILMQYKWCAAESHGNYYATRGRSKDQTKLHWWVVGQPLPGFCVDHINGNTLADWRDNLRIIPLYQNAANTKFKTSSIFPGVCWHKGASKWMARIKIGGVGKYLGVYSSQTEAFCVYREALKLFGREVLPEHEAKYNLLKTLNCKE